MYTAHTTYSQSYKTAMIITTITIINTAHAVVMVSHLMCGCGSIEIEIYGIWERYRVHAVSKIYHLYLVFT